MVDTSRETPVLRGGRLPSPAGLLTRHKPVNLPKMGRRAMTAATTNPTPPPTLTPPASTNPPAPADLPVDELAPRLDVLSAQQLIQWAVDGFGDGVAMTTSFGIQSAVMLHMATTVKPDLPIIWVDTGYLHRETYCYAKQLIDRLGLRVLTYQSAMTPAHMEAVEGKLWETDSVEDLNRYDEVRKVEPLKRAMRELGVRAWLTGLRSDQTDFRTRLPRVEQKAGRLKLYPILRWSAKDV
ncbi:MAG: phosphoadenylyl-sulfate reductase, partial [Planctomycetota bacterium]